MTLSTRSIRQSRHRRSLAHGTLRQIEPLEARWALANDFLLTWAAGLVVGDFGGSRGGIFVSRPDGTEMRQLTVTQTNNFQFSGDGLNLPDDHPSFSPDGTKIVFTTSRFQTDGEINNFEIAIMNVDGTDVRRLTTSPGIDTEPVFSPDGSKIAFVSARAGNLDIWVMNVDGTGLIQLTNNSDDENEPAWSHAGDRLAYTRIIFGGVAGVFAAQKDVYVMRADGTNKQPIAATDREEHDAVWSLDDSKLIITSERGNTLPFGDVQIIDIATRQYGSNLTIDDRFALIGGGGDPTLSPDGTKIAYFKATGGPLLLAGPQKVHVMNANGTGKVKIDAPGIVNVHPHFGKLADTDLDGKPDYIDIDSPSDFNQAMVQDEARVVAALGDLTSLESSVGVGRLAARGYFPAHAFDSFQGIGVVFARDINNNDPSVLGQPDVLVYQPTLTGGRNPTDVLPDFPYRLIGWGYGSNYDPTKVPTFAGFPEDQWLTHEAGFHPISSGEFDPTPPSGDSPRGIRRGNVRPDERPLTPWHPRLWTIQFYRRPNGGTPVASIHDPFGRNLPGHAAGPESFFYPQLPFRATASNGQVIEAENFDMAEDFGWHDVSTGNSGDSYRVTDVDIATSLEDPSGFDVVGIQAGEYLQYSVNLPSGGLHELAMRISNGNPGGKLRIEVDGVNVSGTVDIPTTTTVRPDVYGVFIPLTTQLTAGKHTIRVVFQTIPNGNLAKLRLNSFALRPKVAPTAGLSRPLNIATPAEFTEFDVIYRDNSAIDVSSIDSQDLRVTGPNNYLVTPTLVSKTESTNSAEVIATYRIPAPGTAWDVADNGTYAIQILPNQIKDITGVFLPSRLLTNFSTNIARFGIGIAAHGQPRSTLFVTGTEGADSLSLVRVGNRIDVHSGLTLLGSAMVADLTGIRVHTVGGDDVVNAATLGLPMEVHGGTGNDMIMSGAGNDMLFGEAGNDRLVAGAGDDSLFGGDGNDQLDGGPGVNTFDEGGGSGGIVINGTPGRDVIRVDRDITDAGVVAVVAINGRTRTFPYRRGETIIVHAGGGDDDVRLVGSARRFWRAEFFGGLGDDILVGGRLNDALNGQAGNDQLTGEDGDDSLSGDEGNDVLRGGVGADYLDGGTGDDTLNSGAGHDVLFGGGGDDRLWSGSGRDVLIGGRGVDRLFGDDGDDVLIGGTAAFAEDKDFLRAVSRKWTAAAPLAARQASLRGAIQALKILDDQAVDQLHGQDGRDWFVDFLDRDERLGLGALDVLN